MKVIEKASTATCEWCGNSVRTCEILVYGDSKAKLMCRLCLDSLLEFLEEIDLKEAEVWVDDGEG